MKRARRGTGWDADSVKGLRRHMALTQEQLAEALGVRQQTISEWETGAYRPRGASARLLGLVADGAGYQYGDEGADGREHAPAHGHPAAGERGRGGEAE